MAARKLVPSQNTAHHGGAVFLPGVGGVWPGVRGVSSQGEGGGGRVRDKVRARVSPRVRVRG